MPYSVAFCFLLGAAQWCKIMQNLQLQIISWASRATGTRLEKLRGLWKWATPSPAKKHVVWSTCDRETLYSQSLAIAASHHLWFDCFLADSSHTRRDKKCPTLRVSLSIRMPFNGKNTETRLPSANKLSAPQRRVYCGTIVERNGRLPLRNMM